MDYSHSSVLLVVDVVVVLDVVGAGYFFLKDGLSDLVQIWTKDATPKTIKISFSHDLDPKVKGQNQSSNISFCDKS